MEEKKKYVKPESVIVQFGNNDIILTSGEPNTDIDGDGIPDIYIP